VGVAVIEDFAKTDASKKGTGHCHIYSVLSPIYWEKRDVRNVDVSSRHVGHREKQFP
jgi:hypothetical protein